MMQSEIHELGLIMMLTVTESVTGETAYSHFNDLLTFTIVIRVYVRDAIQKVRFPKITNERIRLPRNVHDNMEVYNILKTT